MQGESISITMICEAGCLTSITRTGGHRNDLVY